MPEPQNTQLQTQSQSEATPKRSSSSASGAANTLLVIKNEPLLFYPELKDADIVNCPVLNDLEKEVIMASLNYPKIRTLDITRGNASTENSDTYNVLVEIVGLAIWTMGVTENSMSRDEQKLFIPVAIDEIKSFPNLSIEDVRIAFKKGSRKHYGIIINGVLSPTLQMSIATVNVWLTQYTNETKKQAILRLPYVKKEEEPKIELTAEQKQKLHTDWLNNIYAKFNAFKLTEVYDFFDFKNQFYLYCKKLNLINFTEKQQEFIWHRAVRELKEEKHPKNATTFGRRIEYKDLYDELKKSDEANKSTQELIIMRARRIAIFYFFKKLVKDNKELKYVIEEAEVKLTTKQI